MTDPHTRTVLIVEDHDTMRASLVKWLTLRFGDYEVLEARSGEEAIQLAAAHPPTAVLMDIGLPQMNGIQATRQIKAIAPNAHVIVLSINEGPAYRTDAALAGASAYVPKRKMHRQLGPILKNLLSIEHHAALGET